MREAQQQPRLKRIATKPLRLAGSLKRGLSPAPSLNRTQSSASSSTNVGGEIVRGPRKPLDGESPAAILRVRIVGCQELVAKDRNGTSDPFVSLLLPPTRHTTPVVKRSLNPTWSASTATFDFPVYLSMAGVLGGRGVEGIIWDKDLMRKEYMGEINVPIHQWFPNDEPVLWSENLPTTSHPLFSTRRRQRVSGTVQLQIGFAAPDNTTGDESLAQIRSVWGEVTSRAAVAAAGVLGVPAYEGIGTVKSKGRGSKSRKSVKSGFFHTTTASILPASSANGPSSADETDDDSDSELVDDGLSSSSEDDEENNITRPVEGLTLSPSQSVSQSETDVNTRVNSVPGDKTLLQPSAIRATGLGYFDTEPTGSTASGATTPVGATTPGGTRRPFFRRGANKTKSSSLGRDYNFNAGKDVLGIVMLEVSSAEDLPKLKNSLRFSFDMDPFVVISFSKKVFRTRVIRHSLNPTWDEKLLFHVRRYESNFTLQFAVLDWDKISGNDAIGSCTLPLSQLVMDAPQPDPETGLYKAGEDGKHEMREFTLPLSTTSKDASWESKHSPKLTFRAKYEPYDALRQKFWRQYIAQYDADDTDTMSYTELTTMLDSLGSTLTQQTLESYFTAFNKSYETDELTFDEVIMCLEHEINKDRSEKQKVHGDEFVSSTLSGAATPGVSAAPVREGMDVTGPDAGHALNADQLAEQIRRSKPRGSFGGSSLDAGNMDAVQVESGGQKLDSKQIPLVNVDKGTAGNSSGASPDESDSDEADASGSSGDDRERVINVKTCPLCHRPRLRKKSEQDILTHLAVCASADWSRVDRIVVGNYVTASQAQRKFFTKILTKVTSGAYSLGANSANILVQDRRTGQLEEEKMAVYVRLGIRMLYKGAKSRMEGARARKLLKSLTLKQGLKYNAPESALEIPTFIAFHGLNVDEIRDPLDSFKTFNEFFYRKLKPDARPITEPENPAVAVSCADCRMMAFETVSDATRIWIKGREFSVGRLLGEQYKEDAHKYEGGALGIFRLAPQDYHRFHSPVEGTVGKMTLIDGEYYTVNPQAIRTTLDVYGENVRKVVPIHTEDFGVVQTVWIGAMMVGSIGTSVEEGQEVKRGDELGWFAFGGSTIVCLFEKGALAWDEDLLNNGKASIETLVRMGTGIGRSTRRESRHSSVGR